MRIEKLINNHMNIHETLYIFRAFNQKKGAEMYTMVYNEILLRCAFLKRKVNNFGCNSW